MGSDTYDALDRQLVHALQLAPRAAFSRLAAVLGVSDQTVARRYGRLRGAGLVRVLGLSDPERLGEARWQLRVRCTPDSAGAVAAALARREDTVWVSLNSGGTEIACSTRTPPDRSDHSLLLQHLPRTPSVSSVTAHCVLHTFFGGAQSLAVKSGALTAGQVAALTEAGPRPAEPGGPAVQLDRTDLRLLAVLAVDGRAPLAELAAACGKSETTVRRRLDELAGSGALYFDLDVDWRIFGLRTHTWLWLNVVPSELAAAGAALAEHPEVAYACATTGPSNLHAVVITRGARELYGYLTTRVAALRGVQHVETAPTIRIVKGPGPRPLQAPRDI
ncbi:MULTISPECIES: AsnC family transcriptional regulator [Kitasatospora]|uniref:Putative AsnC family transcriptional regulator n=1 Tax=Kitasatospora setae (strain ATCC 33774 / DSM 43861 / JCM 3304 / KCC A-0304 / NBRC 14216 / KM-6054) TaxID=452652 RepID=E4NJ09_KITSK|nr:AsnC family transcriptional regulator [Kitasatospora setae]BAJ32957.1 putative AsnC family transcriptional regulator [Kitasatospora setae KM-6054]